MKIRSAPACFAGLPASLADSQGMPAGVVGEQQDEHVRLCVLEVSLDL